MTIYKSESGKGILMNRYDQILSRWPVAYDSRYIDTEFGKTHILEWGTGNETIILLHGSTSNSSMWIGEAETLNDYHVIAVDILGEPGKSDETRLDLKTSDSSEWLSILMTTLNIQEAHLIGNSLGGFLALDFAVRKPNDVKSLTLIATSGLAPARLSFVFKSIKYLMQGEKGVRKLSELVFNGEVEDEVVKLTEEMSLHFKPRMGSLPVFKKELEQLKIPVYYMAGKYDALINTDKSVQNLKHYVPNAKIEVLDCGHVIYGIGKQLNDFVNNNAM